MCESWGREGEWEWSGAQASNLLNWDSKFIDNRPQASFPPQSPTRQTQLSLETYPQGKFSGSAQCGLWQLYITSDLLPTYKGTAKSLIKEANLNRYNQKTLCNSYRFLRSKDCLSLYSAQGHVPAILFQANSVKRNWQLLKHAKSTVQCFIIKPYHTYWNSKICFLVSLKSYNERRHNSTNS